MKIIELNKKEKTIKFLPEKLEDLWTIKTITVIGDVVSGTTYRRQKDEETATSTRKPVFVSVSVEKYDYSSLHNTLRYTGKIIFSNPKELAPLGDYHTIEIELNSVYTLKKKQIFLHEIELLKRKTTDSSVVLVALDLEKAHLFNIKDVGFSEITVVESHLSGKRYKTDTKKEDYFKEIYEIITTTENNQIIVAGPGHTKSQLALYLKDKQKSLNVLEVNLQNITSNSVYELFSKKSVARFFEKSIIYKENNILEDFKKNLGKNNGLVGYGLKDVKKLVSLGACKEILITEKLWRENIEKVQDIILLSEQQKTIVSVVDTKHEEITKVINSFGGIVTNLRYKID
jgi:protein pelota